MTIQAKGVRFSYRTKTGSPIPVFDNLTLQIGGEQIGVIGEEGSGKTTLLLILAGLLRPDSGAVCYDGIEIQAPLPPALRRRVGVVFQFPETQFFCETVGDELMFGPRNLGLPIEESNSYALSILQELHLEPGAILGTSPFTLSMGEARRVAIASVMASRPEVLLLDEPTAGLDGAGVEQTLAALKRFRAEGGGCVIVSHDLDVLAEVVDRIVILGATGIVADAPAREILMNADLLASHGYALPGVVEFMQRLKARGHSVESVLRLNEARQYLTGLKRVG